MTRLTMSLVLVNVVFFTERWLTTRSGSPSAKAGSTIHLDRSPKEDARGDDETNDDAEESHSLRNLTTGELDVCFELLLT